MSEARGALIVLTWIFWPWAIALVDLIAYVTTGAPLSGIWDDTGRAAIVVFWPMAWLFVVGAFTELMG